VLEASRKAQNSLPTEVCREKSDGKKCKHHGRGNKKLKEILTADQYSKHEKMRSRCAQGARGARESARTKRKAIPRRIDSISTSVKSRDGFWPSLFCGAWNVRAPEAAITSSPDILSAGGKQYDARSGDHLVSLGVGIAGYRFLEHMSWLDSFVNAAMILSGMGPVICQSAANRHRQVFCGCYALSVD